MCPFILVLSSYAHITNNTKENAAVGYFIAFYLIVEQRRKGLLIIMSRVCQVLTVVKGPVEK